MNRLIATVVATTRAQLELIDNLRFTDPDNRSTPYYLGGKATAPPLDPAPTAAKFY